MLVFFLRDVALFSENKIKRAPELIPSPAARNLLSRDPPPTKMGGGWVLAVSSGLFIFRRGA